MDENKKKREDLRKMMLWVFPAAFLMLGVVNLFKGDTPVVACLFIIAGGLTFSPPIKAYLAKYMNKYLSFFSRMSLFLVLLAFAIHISRAENAHSQFVSAKHEALYIQIFEDDFLKALNGQQSLISKNDWLNALEIQGEVHANQILKDFNRNEVAATRKYKGSWLIKGRVRSINNSFSSAIVGIGGQSAIFNFGANLKNKDRVATYNVGEEVLIYCGKISETITLISGDGCRDYTDWKFSAITIALQNLPDIKIEKESVSSLREYIPIMHTVVNMLPNNSVCFDDIKSVECSLEMKNTHKNHSVQN